jgi:hypothetical protein
VEDIGGAKVKQAAPPTKAIRTSLSGTPSSPAGQALHHSISGRNINVKLVEPPSCSSPSAIVFIGKNSRGNWVAQQQHGLYGGLFVNRAQAVKYALFENGHHPETIIELSREIELDIGGTLSFSAAETRRAA